MSEKTKTYGVFKVVDPRGYIYIPVQAQQDLGLDFNKKDNEINYVSSPNVVLLLLKKGMSIEETLKSIDVLRSEINLQRLDSAKFGDKKK